MASPAVRFLGRRIDARGAMAGVNPAVLSSCMAAVPLALVEARVHSVAPAPNSLRFQSDAQLSVYFIPGIAVFLNPAGSSKAEASTDPLVSFVSSERKSSLPDLSLWMLRTGKPGTWSSRG